MSTSGQTYKSLAIPFFKESFDCIDEVMKGLGFPYYLIGVSAIALELLKHGVKPIRGTKDIDFAVMISSIKDYEKISRALEGRGFRKVSAPWTFYSETFNLAIDLLPFGEIEKNHTTGFHERGVDLHVLGFREVLEEAVPIAIEEKIANILKIIQHYYDLAWDEIVEQHHDILNNDPFDPLLIAAEVLGRNARLYLQKSEAIAQRVLRVLEGNLRDAARSAIAKEWARKLGSDLTYAHALLRAFQKGIMP